MQNDNAGGWPDAARPGVPLNPERDGWHWLINDAGRCAMWWLAKAGGWCGSDGAGQQACDMPPDEAVDYYDACEPIITPAEIAAREAAAWCAGRDAAAADVDCGCAARPDVMARYASEGHKRASYLCPDGDACCALQAASIRALTPPASFAAALEAVRAEEREACVEVVRLAIVAAYAKPETWNPSMAFDKAAAIRALPLPADAQAALDAVVQAAVEREREACAAMFDGNALWVEAAIAAAIRARREVGHDLR